MFEKKFGDRRGIEDVIINKRRFKYETEIKQNPLNYDAWFDLLRLLEADCSIEDVRDTYERAIANIPLVVSKKGWRRYIFISHSYFIFCLLRSELQRAGGGVNPVKHPFSDFNILLDHLIRTCVLEISHAKILGLPVLTL